MLSSTRMDTFAPNRMSTGWKRSSAPCSNAARCSTISTSMALGTRVWGAGKLLFLGGALLTTYVLFAAASMRIALRAREVTVPDLTNSTANDATALASNLGLTLRVDETRRPDPKIAAGRVLAQEPAAGSIARRQRSVKVWLSAGQRASTVPQLVGETERTAQL